MKQVSPPRMKVEGGFLLSTQHSALSTFKLGGWGRINYQCPMPKQFLHLIQV